jgi:hypothetical protein
MERRPLTMTSHQARNKTVDAHNSGEDITRASCSSTAIATALIAFRVPPVITVNAVKSVVSKDAVNAVSEGRKVTMAMIEACLTVALHVTELLADGIDSCRHPVLVMGDLRASKPSGDNAAQQRPWLSQELQFTGVRIRLARRIPADNVKSIAKIVASQIRRIGTVVAVMTTTPRRQEVTVAPPSRLSVKPANCADADAVHLELLGGERWTRVFRDLVFNAPANASLWLPTTFELPDQRRRASDKPEVAPVGRRPARAEVVNVD